MKSSLFKRESGFTLIELLVVIGILAVLLAITLIAINPAKHFADANDTQRRSDATAILNAIGAYMSKNGGVPPASITSSSLEISNTAADICADLVPTYIADLPSDPKNGTRTPAGSVCTSATAYDTGYTVLKSANDNRVTVAAPHAQGGITISVTR